MTVREIIDKCEASQLVSVVDFINCNEKDADTLFSGLILDLKYRKIELHNLEVIYVQAVLGEVLRLVVDADRLLEKKKVFEEEMCEMIHEMLNE